MKQQKKARIKMDHVKFGKSFKHYIDPPIIPTDEEVKSFGSDLKAVIKEKLTELNSRDFYITRRNEARIRKIQKLTKPRSLEEWLSLEYVATEYEEHFYIYRWQKYWLSILDRLNPKKISQHVGRSLDVEGAKQFPIEQLYPNQLRQFGGKLAGLCPFHSEKTPSFFIFDDNHWFCFGACGEGGDAIDFQMRLKGLDFKDAVRSLQ